MNDGKIAVRYAKALYELAVEQSKEAQVYEDVKVFFETSFLEDFKQLLNNPAIKPSEKSKSLNDIFKNHTDKLSMSFLDLLIKNKREKYLQSISRSFLALYRKRKGIKSVTFTTAKRIDQTLEKYIAKVVGENFNTNVELKTVIDEGIIGGFILKIEDRQYDAGIASKLQKIKTELLNSVV